MTPLIERDVLKTQIYLLIKKYSSHTDLILTEDMSVQDLGVDSIDLMEIIFHLEESYKIEIEEGKLESLSKLSDIIDLAANSQPESQ